MVCCGSRVPSPGAERTLSHRRRPARQVVDVRPSPGRGPRRRHRNLRPGAPARERTQRPGRRRSSPSKPKALGGTDRGPPPPPYHHARTTNPKTSTNLPARSTTTERAGEEQGGTKSRRMIEALRKIERHGQRGGRTERNGTGSAHRGRIPLRAACPPGRPPARSSPSRMRRPMVQAAGGTNSWLTLFDALAHGRAR